MSAIGVPSQTRSNGRGMPKFAPERDTPLGPNPTTANQRFLCDVTVRRAPAKLPADTCPSHLSERAK
jgi:hypothetical protein